MSKVILTGDEALARGAYEAGALVAAAYPGTPSTEIVENFSKYDGIYAEWSVNEKVACEVAAGASTRGARSFAAMKHVGLNVAADAFTSYSYHHINGGFVLISADEPGMHSSQNEQDNRHYAPLAKTPMLEPSDSRECVEFMKAAFEISEEYDTPVLMRVTTRICHSKSVVELGPRNVPPLKEFTKDIKQMLMVPANARLRHPIIEHERIPRLKELSNKCKFNSIEYHSKKIGIIANGISFQYAKEVMGENASYLKIGLSYPMPDKLITEFAKEVETLYVVEEGDSYMEDFVKTLGINCIGKELFSHCGEFSPGLVREKLTGKKAEKHFSTSLEAPSRPPVLCAGCPHRGLFYELGKYSQKAYFSGDIGCYSLGALPPLSAHDSLLCMGGAITVAHGFEKATNISGARTYKKTFSIIGDSTFFHSGVTGLINAVYNKAGITMIILDNSITGMTGHQDNPGTGKTVMGEDAPKVDIEALCTACGVKAENIVTCDPYSLDETANALKAGFEADEPFVIIAKRECALLKPVIKKREKMKCKVVSEKCRSCKKCLKTGCPALVMDEKASIDSTNCNGCTICKQVCPFDAIESVGE
ncbi:MAG: indolepyruvate ferredoxin oxidoreductase subunit alpha [Firmicutes bacterium]|nr:indolepyruvate ferredoxin oxidoreductase subunit alpha [Bacillota bacterium]